MELIRIEVPRLRMEDLPRRLAALTVEAERAEVLAVLNGKGAKVCTANSKPPLVLRYHKGSKKMGKPYGIDCRLWDVLSPRLEGYVYNSESHVPTLSVEGMRERGLLKWY